MSIEQDYPELLFNDDFSDRVAYEIRYKGWFVARVKLNDGSIVTMTFFDPIRLNQEVEDEFKRGSLFFVEENLIIVPEVTVEAIQAAIKVLWERGFFTEIKTEK